MACLLTLQHLRVPNAPSSSSDVVLAAATRTTRSSPSCAVLTDIGGDHVGLHGNKRNYVAAKAGCSGTSWTPPPAARSAGLDVLNADEPTEPSSPRRARPQVEVASYSTTGRPERPGAVAIWAEDPGGGGGRHRSASAGCRAATAPCQSLVRVVQRLQRARRARLAVAPRRRSGTATEAAAALPGAAGSLRGPPRRTDAPTVVVDSPTRRRACGRPWRLPRRQPGPDACRRLRVPAATITRRNAAGVAQSPCARRPHPAAPTGQLAIRGAVGHRGHDPPRCCPAPVRHTAEIMLDRRLR